MQDDTARKVAVVSPTVLSPAAQERHQASDRKRQQTDPGGLRPVAPATQADAKGKRVSRPELSRTLCCPCGSSCSPSTHLPGKLLKQAPQLAVFLLHLAGLWLKGRAVAKLRWDSLRKMKDEDITMNLYLFSLFSFLSFFLTSKHFLRNRKT